MSVTLPFQRGKLLIGKALSTEVSTKDFLDNAIALDVAVLGADGGDIALNKPFYVAQKNDGSRGENYSEKINPKAIDRITAFKYTPELGKIVKVTGFSGTPINNATYRIAIRLYDGIQSPENFRHIFGFVVVTNASTTYEDILLEMEANLKKAVSKEGLGSQFKISSNYDLDPLLSYIEIEGLILPFIQAKNEGDPVYFDVETSVIDNCYKQDCASSVYDVLDVEISQNVNPGTGTYKAMRNTEWFFNGWNNGDYSREVGFPSSFDGEFWTQSGKTYNTVIIHYHQDRDYVNIERQKRSLFLGFEEAPGTFVVANAVLAKLRTVTGLTILELPDLV